MVKYDKVFFLTLSLYNSKQPLKWPHFFPLLATECAQIMNVLNSTFLPYHDFPFLVKLDAHFTLMPSSLPAGK